MENLNLRKVEPTKEQRAQGWVTEMLIPAVIVQRPAHDELTADNTNGTLYGTCQLKLVLPGTEYDGDIVDAKLYKNSDAKHNGKYQVGMNVDFRMQAEGEYIGNGVVQLPGTRRYAKASGLAKLAGIATADAVAETTKELPVKY